MITEDYVPLSQHDILNAQECASIRDRVLALKRCWKERAPNQTFYTLGTASYLDAPGQRPAYLESARVTNPLLRKSFPDVYPLLAEFFEEMLEAPTFYDEEYALPGFHVHAFHGPLSHEDNPAPRAHFDLQWSHALAGIAPLGTLSFTLLIEEPSAGASMAIWPIRYQEAVRLGLSGRDYAARHAPQTVPYQRGRIVIHDGLVLHAIGAAPTSSNGLRITLQGHAVRLPRGWMLYW